MIRWILCLAILGIATSPAATLFRATLTPDQVVPKPPACDPLSDAGCEPIPSPEGISTASAVALLSMDLNNGAPFVDYQIQFSGLDLENEVTGVHIHFGHSAVVLDVPRLVPRHLAPGDSNGRHVLNIFGLPREDDADLVAEFSTHTLTGRWDNGDQNLGPNGTPDAGDSIAVGAMLDDLIAGDLYIQVHTKQFPAPLTAELRGQILPVPEPSVVALLGLVGLSLVLRRERWNRNWK